MRKLLTPILVFLLVMLVLPGRLICRENRWEQDYFSSWFVFNTLPGPHFASSSSPFSFNTTPLPVLSRKAPAFVFNTLTSPQHDFLSAPFTFNTKALAEMSKASHAFMFNTALEYQTLIAYSGLFTFSTIIVPDDVFAFSSPFLFNTTARQTIIEYSDDFTYDTLPEEEYLVTVTVLPENAGMVIGEGLYAGGVEVELQAWAHDGYVFSQWLNADGEPLSDHPEYSFIMPDQDLHLTAQFTEMQFDVQVDINPPGSGSVSGAGWHTYGHPVQLEATPNEGFAFVHWTDPDGEVLSDNSVYQFTMPAENLQLVANFTLTLYEVLVDVVPEEGGSVSGAGFYTLGQAVTLIAEAGEGFLFASWADGSGDVISTDATYQFIMPAEEVYMLASFEEIEPGVGVLSDLVVKVYPNPARHSVSIQSNRPFSSIAIFDTAGQLQQQEAINKPEGEISISHLPAGIYILQINFGEYMHYERLFVL